MKYISIVYRECYECVTEHDVSFLFAVNIIYVCICNCYPKVSNKQCPSVSTSPMLNTFTLYSVCLTIIVMTRKPNFLQVLVKLVYPPGD